MNDATSNPRPTPADAPTATSSGTSHDAPIALRGFVDGDDWVVIRPSWLTDDDTWLGLLGKLDAEFVRLIGSTCRVPA